MYILKEIYHTLQGEGFHTGRPAVFIRFSGCNLWTGREEDRYKAICQFCDTDFIGTDGINGGKYKKEELVKLVQKLWLDEHKDLKELFVVCTGGEPALQLDQALVDTFHENGITIAIETNGTESLPENIDWICVSPKANTELVIKKGHEIKIVHPQKGVDPKDFEHLDFEHFFLQPMDSEDLESNTETVKAYCEELNPWKISLQTHKILGIP